MSEKQVGSGEYKEIGKVFGTPLLVKGITWLPITQVIALFGLVWWAGKRKPSRSIVQRFVVGALSMPVVLGAEWGHNLAHAKAAILTGKPMDALVIQFGMPRVYYKSLDDHDVTPREHILRASGGPVFNLIFMLLWRIIRIFTKDGTILGDVTDAAVAANTFLCTVSLIPVPGIDGGPILKWSLVDRGFKENEADEVVRKVNGWTSPLYLMLAAFFLKKRQHLLAMIFFQFSAIAYAFFRKWIREEEFSVVKE